MKIIIGADLVPTESNSEFFRTGDVKSLLGTELTEYIGSVDYRVFNLEVPLVDNKQPIEKCGPNLIASTDTILGYKAIGTDLLTLANNHILDQGEEGLKSTINLLQENGLEYLGAGINIEEAQKPHVLEIDNKRIGIYACAEYEFSIATERTAGANPFDPFESLEHIKNLKNDCEYVIVLYHGGKEHYRYPSPMLQKTCRKIVDAGADLVICQHSHCIGCEEKYRNSTIVYGQGNFLFDYSNSEFWQTSLIVQLDSSFNIKYIPIQKVGNSVCLASDTEAKKILDDFTKRSNQIIKVGFIEENYIEFARSMISGYLITMSGLSNNFIFRAINKITGYRFANYVISKRYNRKTLLALRNFIECEAHRELFLKGVDVKIGKK